MAYSYRNRKNGDTITTTNRVSGKNWEPIKNSQRPSADEPPFDNTHEEETVEEVPKETPKPSRRGKK